MFGRFGEVRAMTGDQISLIISFISMLLYASSYLFRRKSTYLIFQGLGGFLLMFSYLFIGNYFAMISMFLWIFRTASYFWFEIKDRPVPVWFVVANCIVLILNYIVVNMLILHTASFVDIIFLITSCLYAIVFSFRNLQMVRYTITVPLALTVVYNVLINAPIFTVISFSFELLVAIATIIYFSRPNNR